MSCFIEHNTTAPRQLYGAVLSKIWHDQGIWQVYLPLCIVFQCISLLTDTYACLNRRLAVNYGLERMNIEVASWMRRDKLTDEDGFATPPFLAMGDGNSVMWNRQLSRESYTNPIDRFHACNMVSQALARIGAKRLVVGHTPQVGADWWHASLGTRLDLCCVF